MANPSEITSKLPPLAGSRKFFSTRRGTILLAVVAGVAALAILLVFMSNYRNSVATAPADVRVLTADRLIDKGTSGEVLAEAGLVEAISVTEDDAAEAAITDVATLDGMVTTEPIYPGQQVTMADLAPGADPIAGKLTGTQRAISVPVDAARGNIGQIEVGSRVDVLGGFNATGLEGLLSGRSAPSVVTIARDVMVLKVPTEEGGGVGADGAQVSLRVSDVQASQIALAADAGEIWITVRPPTLAKDSKVNPAKFDNLLGLGTIAGR